MISWAQPFLDEHERALLVDAYDSHWISGGAYVDRFEADFAAALNVSQGMTVSNGTCALYLALLGIGVCAGDHVIVPGYGFMAAANMVMTLGAVPVFVDVDASTWCLDPRQVEQAITDKTKAIVAIHTYGNVCDMQALKDIAVAHDLVVIEDAAEACFSQYKNQYAGTLADVGCFSFQATKTLVMGEGGVCDHSAY